MKWAFNEFIWPRRGMIALGLVLIVIRSLTGMVIPYETKILLDDIVPSGDVAGLKNVISFVCVAIFIQAITSFALTRLLSVEAQFLISQLRAQVQKKLLTLPV